MSDLGKAYVQIMPSAKGISGSIQKSINPEATAAGKSAGSRIASSISNSMGSLGKTLTKSLTVPALGAATAVTGLVGALGFKRLAGMDVARAKLEGLGFEGKQLETIMNNAKNAVQGTTFATADGAYVAAGALAAGVAEGAELERYIKLVGDAAIGAGVPIEEMSQIFDRVTSTGKLTRNELEMINYRLPGFANAMMDHVGVSSLDAFSEMASAGKVGTDDLLHVMDDFAGGMADAYAGTFSGLKDNILANIGIIGEALLVGLFEDGKEGMAEFLDFLRNSEGLQEWATETGETLRDIFGKIVETVKDAIDWWTGLDDSTKELITTIAGIVVVAGPVLMVVTKMITTAATLASGFAMLKTAAVVVGGAIGAISAPVLIAVGAIASIIAIGVALYKNWDTVKAKASQLGQWLSQTWSNIRNAVSNAISTVRNAISNGLNRAFSTVTNFFGRFKDAGRRIVTSIADGIKAAIGAVTGAIGNIASKIRSFLPFSPAKEGPLKDLDKLNFGGTISLGIDDGADEVQRAMDSMLSTPMRATLHSGSTGMNSNNNALMELLKDIRDATEANRDLIIDGQRFARVTAPYTSAELGNQVRRTGRGLA